MKIDVPDWIATSLSRLTELMAGNLRPAVALLTISKNASYWGSAAEVSFNVRLFSLRDVST